MGVMVVMVKQEPLPRLSRRSCVLNGLKVNIEAIGKVVYDDLTEEEINRWMNG